MVQPLVDLANSPAIRYGVVAVVLFLMALPLEARWMWRAVRQPGPALLGIAMNSVAVPALTWLVVTLLPSGWLARDLTLGLLVMSAIPSTLASAAVWTRRAGGNDAVSIMVTVITNASCFLVTPLWIFWFTGQSAGVDAWAMIRHLALFVVLPMVIAQLVRLARSIGRWASLHTPALSTLAQVGILVIVYFGAVQTAQKFQAGRQGPLVAELILIAAAAAGIHLATLVAGVLAARKLNMSRPNQIAVGISGSQKTLAVGLQVCMELGFSILPVVAYHIMQLLLDTVIVDRWRKRNT